MLWTEWQQSRLELNLKGSDDFVRHSPEILNTRKHNVKET
jgi:hypothetical protein